MVKKNLPARIEITITGKNATNETRARLTEILDLLQELSTSSKDTIGVETFSTSIISDKNSHSSLDTDKIKEKLQEIDEKLKDRERRYLKREDWKDPEKSEQAEVNKSATKIAARLSFDHKDLFERAASKFPSKRDALERAVELLAAEAEITPENK